MLEMTPCPEVTRLSTDPLWVVSLDHAGAADGALTGAKASALARAASAGLPVLPGSGHHHAWCGGPGRPVPAAPGPCGPCSACGRPRPVPTAPSSSGPPPPSRTAPSSSMAGRFQSVLDVAGWDAFVAAVDEVLASAVIEGHDVAPMAVLVQPMLQPRLGGVLFGADPISGRTDRLLLDRCRGWSRPARVGAGRRHPARPLAHGPTARPSRGPARPRRRRERRALAGLAARTAAGVRRSAGHRVGRRRRRPSCSCRAGPSPRWRRSRRPGPGARSRPGRRDASRRPRRRWRPTSGSRLCATASPTALRLSRHRRPRGRWPAPRS